MLISQPLLLETSCHLGSKDIMGCPKSWAHKQKIFCQTPEKWKAIPLWFLPNLDQIWPHHFSTQIKRAPCQWYEMGVRSWVFLWKVGQMKCIDIKWKNSKCSYLSFYCLKQVATWDLKILRAVLKVEYINRKFLSDP